MGPQSTEKHLRLVTSLVRQGYANRILLSHDAGWYNVGQAKGGAIRPYTALSDTLLPALEKVLTEHQIREIMVTNPSRAFRVEVRKLPPW